MAMDSCDNIIYLVMNSNYVIKLIFLNKIAPSFMYVVNFLLHRVHIITFYKFFYYRYSSFNFHVVVIRDPQACCQSFVILL